MAIRPYNGTARPIDSVYEGKEQSVEWDAPDGSIMRGYQRSSDGALVSGACVQVSPARQAELDKINAAVEAERQGDDNFFAAMRARFADVKALPNTPERHLLLMAVRMLFNIRRNSQDI
jgi:hypothetical protein